MKNKAVTKTKFTMNGKTSVIETPMFSPSGHQQYSGFGFHDKSRGAERRQRKMEEKKLQREYWLE